MLVHSVFFLLIKEATPLQRQEFEQALHGLEQIASIREAYVGQPTISTHGAQDRSFSFALTILFDDMASHDAYQIDSIHQQFVRRFTPLFANVNVYDAR